MKNFYILVALMLLMIATAVFGLVCWNDCCVPVRPPSVEETRLRNQRWEEEMQRVGHGSPFGMPTSIAVFAFASVAAAVFGRLAYNEAHK